MKKTIVAVLTIFFALLGCSKVEPEIDSTSVLKVATFFSGRIEIDGKKASIEELETKLKILKEKNGVVWYYRESGKEEPSEEMMTVFMKLIEAKAPMSLSSKSDFSDYIDENGHSKPRMKKP